MATCGNRAKAARHRVRLRQAGDSTLADTGSNGLVDTRVDALVVIAPPAHEPR